MANYANNVCHGCNTDVSISAHFRLYDDNEQSFCDNCWDERNLSKNAPITDCLDKYKSDVIFMENK